MTESDVIKEIKTVLQERIENQQPTPAPWLTTVVVEAHADLRGNDADWYKFCAYGYVRNTVRKVVNTYKEISGKRTDEQLLLPGFKRLQKFYALDRGDEAVFVPIAQMSDEEIEEKIREYAAMAVGCKQHAKELQRYLSERNGKVNGALPPAASQRRVA